MDHAGLAAAWVLWCALHSGMISLTATDLLKKKFGSRYRFYRLFFNLISVLTLIPVIVYTESLRGGVLFESTGPARACQAALLLAGIALFIAGARHYDLLQLLGFRQIMTGAAHGTLTESGKIDTSGIMGVTRHPWYLGALLLIWSNWMRDYEPAALTVIAVLTAYLVIGTILEERKLVVELGDDYRRYQKRVSMLFPFRFLNSKLTPKDS
ncbi:methyltransferase family protein [Elusimicrobiota bacterium]